MPSLDPTHKVKQSHGNEIIVFMEAIRGKSAKFVAREVECGHDGAVSDCKSRTINIRLCLP